MQSSVANALIYLGEQAVQLARSQVLLHLTLLGVVFPVVQVASHLSSLFQRTPRDSGFDLGKCADVRKRTLGERARQACRCCCRPERPRTRACRLGPTPGNAGLKQVSAPARQPFWASQPGASSGMLLSSSMYRDKKVVVVMPAYNAAKTLRQTYGEVREQQLVDDIILVDDGSRDETVSVARSLPGVRVHVHEVN